MLTILCLFLVFYPTTSASISNTTVTVTIEGPADTIEYIGSAFNLTCKTSGSDRTGKISWYRNGLRLHNDAIGEEIEILEEKTDIGITSIYSVKNAKKTDSGLYNCRTGRFAHASVSVTVKVRRASISHPVQTFYGDGESIVLICSIPTSPDVDVNIVWIKNEQILDDCSEKRLDMEIELEAEVSKLTSKLLINNATINDSGTYTCSPQGGGLAEPDIIYIIVASVPSNSEPINVVTDEIDDSTALSVTPLKTVAAETTTALPRFIIPIVKILNKHHITIPPYVGPLLSVFNQNDTLIRPYLDPFLPILNETDAFSATIPPFIESFLTSFDENETIKSYVKPFFSAFNDYNNNDIQKMEVSSSLPPPVLYKNPLDDYPYTQQRETHIYSSATSIKGGISIILSIFVIILCQIKINELLS